MGIPFFRAPSGKQSELFAVNKAIQHTVRTEVESADDNPFAALEAMAISLRVSDTNNLLQNSSWTPTQTE